ncbi:hypothetical protein RUND412_002944 [Rhizina undulata]
MRISRKRYFVVERSCGLDWGRLERAMEDLFTFSLAKRKGSGDSFWVHPLVHTWTRQRINPTERRQNAEKAITLVTSTIVTNEYEKSPDDWIFTRRILSHLNVCHEHMSEYFSGSDTTPGIATASSTIGSAYLQLGFYSQAGVSYRNALALHEKALGTDHPDTLKTMNDTATAFGDQGRYQEALKIHQRSLAGREKALGSDHSDTLLSVNNMAMVFSRQGRYSEALEMYERALAGFEKAFGSDHPLTLTAVSNMACVFYEQGRHDDALHWFQRALLGFEKALGKDHPDTLNSANFIAMVYAVMQERERETQDLSLRQEASTVRGVSPEAMPLLMQETEGRGQPTRLFKRTCCTVQ